MSSELVIKDLSFEFRNHTKNFDKFNLTLPEVPIVGIVGKNGIGKTLLAEIIIGKYKQTNGQIFIDKINVGNLKISERAKIVNLSFQRSNFAFYKTTVIEEVIEVIKNNDLKLKMLEREEQAENLLNNYGLLQKAKNNPFTLSGGERRLLSFLLLDIIDPNILIFDEPTIGLDAEEKAYLRNLILKKKEKNKRIIVLTHDINFLSKITDYFIVLDKNNTKKATEIGFMGKIFDFYNYQLHKKFPELFDFPLIKKYNQLLDQKNNKMLQEMMKKIENYKIFNTKKSI
ncbi:MAG: ABC transporter ATP-binding protein [Candidatus Hodarchaeales archaeon]